MTLPKVTVGKIRFEVDVDVEDNVAKILVEYLNAYPEIEVVWSGIDRFTDGLCITANKGVTIETVVGYINNWLATESSKLQNV